MSNVYWIRFGDGDPSNYSGLSPTFTKFHSYTGGILSAPGFTEAIAGSGIYQFTYTPSFPIGFTADAATTGIINVLRFVTGSLDPSDMIDVEVGAIGASLSAISTTFGDLAVKVGATTSSFGTASTDPGDLFGFLKRVQELLEGNQTFSKTTGAFDLYDRTGGITLRSKTVSNSASGVTRS